MSKATITQEVRNKLSVLTGARCSRCNMYLLEDFLTKLPTEFREYAHIIADSNNGPRANPLFTDKESAENIIILCPTCHKMIDTDTKTYTEDVLRELKKNHEERIYYLTSLVNSRKAVPIIFHTKIGDREVTFNNYQIQKAILEENYYPDDKPYLQIIINNSTKDNTESYYLEIIREIDEQLYRYQQIISMNTVVLFGLAPQPLLIYLGTKLQNTSNVIVKQRSRVTNDWCWEDDKTRIIYNFIESKTVHLENEIALVICISDNINDTRIQSVITNSDVWKITVENPNMNIIKNRNMVDDFSLVMMKAFATIKEKYGIDKPIHIFPAMPVSLAIQLGRVWMPKANNSLVIYDQNYTTEDKKFIKTITIE